jgi:asparagine synthase (glutamine-hydrolysing)
LLDESRLRREGYFEPREVQRIWQDHLSGRRQRTFLIWSLLTFQAWQETWIAGDGAVTIGAAA